MSVSKIGGQIMTFSFNNSQRLGLDLDKHIAIDAGAGTAAR